MPTYSTDGDRGSLWSGLDAYDRPRPVAGCVMRNCEVTLVARDNANAYAANEHHQRLQCVSLLGTLGSSLGAFAAP